MKKATNIIAILCVAAMLLTGCQMAPQEVGHVHTLIHNAEKAPTCVNNGILEHWYCPGCNARFADEAATKEVTFADLEVEERGHTAAEDDGDCTTAIDCVVCGKVATPAAAHTPGEDDGDCTTAIACTTCGKEAVAAKAEHTPAEDDGDCTTAVKCVNCDHIVTEGKEAHIAAEDDGDCTTAVKCQNCDHIVTEGKEAHTPNADDGDCTTAITCSVCGKETTAAKAHTPNTDDGDCTTAITCSVCGKETTPAKTHTPNADDGDCTTAVKCANCEQIVVAAKTHDFGDNNPACGNCGIENPDYVPPTTEPPATEPPATEPPVIVSAPITNWLVSGAFANDQVYAAGNGTSSGPQLSIDASLTTGWNPQASGHYVDEPGIVYTLDGWYDLTKVELTLNANNYYFKIFGSSDGISYTELAAVNADNAGSIYSGNVATVTVAGKAVHYVRIIFTGRAVNNDFITLYNVAISGAVVAEPEATQLPTATKQVTIVNGTIYGTFTAAGTVANSYDGSLTTKWSPTTDGNYNKHPGVIYELDDAYDLTKLELNFKDGKKQFFTILGSADGTTYTTLATVGIDNLADIYLSENIATVNVAAEGIRYVKIIFSGRDGGGQWIHLNEIAIFGKA